MFDKLEVIIQRTYSDRMPPYLVTLYEDSFGEGCLVQTRAVMDDFGFLVFGKGWR